MGAEERVGLFGFWQCFASQSIQSIGQVVIKNPKLRLEALYRAIDYLDNRDAGVDIVLCSRQADQCRIPWRVMSRGIRFGLLTRNHSREGSLSGSPN